MVVVYTVNPHLSVEQIIIPNYVRVREATTEGQRDTEGHSEPTFYKFFLVQFNCVKIRILLGDY